VSIAANLTWQVPRRSGGARGGRSCLETATKTLFARAKSGSERIRGIPAKPRPIHAHESRHVGAQAEIYARATGYIADGNVDIGDRVKQGDQLVELAVPEQDDQIPQTAATRNQLQSALDQAPANLKLAQVTWDRHRPLVNEGWATQQQGTIEARTLKAYDAAVGVARANITAQDKLGFNVFGRPREGLRDLQSPQLIFGDATTGPTMEQ
jgi:hypothetical protein